ncbi:hypothetical protein [Vibrio paracholerae]|uniref:hypothetical protein n=1 Tax=Vibrio paracholerae TaxID=650003 RepID=UPI0015E7C35C|nr:MULTISPECIES: hypothetical protein [Vibrio]
MSQGIHHKCGQADDFAINVEYILLYYLKPEKQYHIPVGLLQGDDHFQFIHFKVVG